MSPIGPDVALVFSPEPWVEELHRHLAHHGGARVRQIVVEPTVALDEEYDVLVVSDRWPALTHGLVRSVHDRSCRVLGVFDPEEPAGKDHLVDLGVDATIAADADVGEFVSVLRVLDVVATADAEPMRSVGDGEDGLVGRLVLVSGPRGSGVTEIALGVAGALADPGRSVLLLDAHESSPALAGRLGLALEPNLRTAVDACAHAMGTLAECSSPVDRRSGGRLHVVAGHPSSIAAAHVSTQDVLDVVAAARRDHDVVVVDVEARSATARALIGFDGAVVGVVHASPVGVVRGLEWAADAVPRSSASPLHLVVNHAPRSSFRQEEIRAEIERTVRPTSMHWCPRDQAVESAAWDGRPVGRGALRAACARVAAAVAPTTATRGRWWR